MQYDDSSFLELSVPGPGEVLTDAEAHLARTLGVKHLRHEADHSSQCSSEVKNERSSTSPPPISLPGMKTDDFYLFHTRSPHVSNVAYRWNVSGTVLTSDCQSDELLQRRPLAIFFSYPCLLFWRREADIRLNKNATNRSTRQAWELCSKTRVLCCLIFCQAAAVPPQVSVTSSSLFRLLVYKTTLSVCWIVESERKIQGPTYRRWFYSTVKKQCLWTQAFWSMVWVTASGRLKKMINISTLKFDVILTVHRR